MKFRYGKIFRHMSDDNKVLIEIIDYSPAENADYYKFIKEQGENGHIQVIVNSHIMLQLLFYYFIERSFDIVNIELMEDDNEFSNLCNNLIAQANSDRAYFARLIEQLNFLFNEDCIEIFKISLKKREISSEVIRIDFQSNGMTRITDNGYSSECSKLKIELEKMYNG